MAKEESKWGADKASEMVKRDGQPDGKDLKAWSNYSTSNSYHCDKAQLRHDIGTEGANADYKAGDVKDWKQPQRNDAKSRYWSDPINKAAVPNTDTGKKRD